MTNAKKIVITNYLEAILKGDKNGLQNMYLEYFPYILSLVKKYNRSEDDAKDLFQEAVMLVYYKASQPEFELTSQFKTYFFGICRNLWGNHIQKKSFYHVTIPDNVKYIDESSNSYENDYYAERRLLFDRAFKLLNKDCQKLLMLFFRKTSMNEIAKKIGFKSEGYARRRKHQCKERLTKLVKRQPGYKELCIEDEFEKKNS